MALSEEQIAEVEKKVDRYRREQLFLAEFPNCRDVPRRRFLETPTNLLELSVRANRTIQEMGLYFVSDLIRVSEQDILAWPECGKTTLREIKEFLADHGLHLDMQIEPMNAMG